MRWPFGGALLFLMTFAASAESLYSNSTFKPLTVDKRAYRVGDALTVLVLENASAFNRADTDLDRKTEISGSVNTDVRDFNGGLGFGSGSTGSGETSRVNRLQAQLTATVTEVSSNGDLHISGSKTIEVNREQQIFRLVGRVRREDIGPDNTVASTRLSDVKILFSGDGDISDKQRPGLVSRLLEWLGLL